jgi:hypothetical protein
MNTTHTNFANPTLEQIARSVETLRGGTVPVLNRITTDADKLARRSVKAVRQSSEHLRGQATRASVTMLRCINDEPVKAVLIATAAGAALMALRNLTSRGARG